MPRTNIQPQAKKNKPIPLYATIRVTARIVGVGERVIRRAIRAGEIPVATISGWLALSIYAVVETL